MACDVQTSIFGENLYNGGANIGFYIFFSRITAQHTVCINKTLLNIEFRCQNQTLRLIFGKLLPSDGECLIFAFSYNSVYPFLNESVHTLTFRKVIPC